MIVIDRLGHNIEDLLELCGGRFSLKTVLLLADQMLLRTQVNNSCHLSPSLSGCVDELASKCIPVASCTETSSQTTS